MDPAHLTDLQLDALREVTNIGCGAAATALAQLLGGRRVELEVTRSTVVATSELEAHLNGIGESVAGVKVQLRGGAEGNLVLVHPDRDARALARLLTTAPVPAAGPLGELGASALMEVGNIVASAYLTAVGRVTGLMLLPSVPSLIHDTSPHVAAALTEAAGGADRLLVLETWMHLREADEVSGHVLIVPAAGSLDVLLGALGL